MSTEEFKSWYARQDIDYKEDCDAWSASQGWSAAIDAVIAEWEKPWGKADGKPFIERLRAMQEKVRMDNAHKLTGRGTGQND